MSEDEVMRKRLTVEGDGGSDDKRIMSLVKTFLHWAQSNSMSEEEIEATHQKMHFTLGQCECSFTKTALVLEMNKREMERYERVYSEIETKIEDAKVQITEYKEDLQKARVIRRHRQEYDALAKIIQKQPPRNQSLNKIAELEKKLQTLISNRKSLNLKLEMRKKQCHLLVQCVHQLQDSLMRGDYEGWEGEEEELGGDDGVGMEVEEEES